VLVDKLRLVPFLHGLIESVSVMGVAILSAVDDEALSAALEKAVGELA
jgi:hypothetical protein